MEQYFKLKENGTNVRTEVIAGITTFFTMAYFIFVNQGILADAGMDPTSVMIATCIAAAVGTALTGLLSNYPFAQAPGMGLNAFFAYTVCIGMGYSWKAALAAVFISGCIFIVITVTNLRTMIVNAIPMTLKRAIAAGIGLFIALIGMTNAGLLSNTTGTIIALGDLSAPTAILTVVSLLFLIVLLLKKVKGALFIGIIATSVVGAIFQFGLNTELGITAPNFDNMVFRLDGFGAFVGGFGELFTFSEGVGAGIVSVLTVFISLTTVDMFDTVGTLVGTAEKAGFLDKDGKLPRADKAMLADAVATVTGAVFGTSTVTTYVESTAGVSEGGRTGLTSMVVAGLFLVSIVLFPLIGLVPTAATAPVLIIVGVMMVSSLKNIEWGDLEEAIPAFMTVVMMPFAYSIADGIGLGFIFWCVVKLVTGKGAKVSPIMYGVALLFVLRYVVLAI